MVNIREKENESLVIDAITSIHYFEFDDSFEDSLETHRQWELVYVDRGECVVISDGERINLGQGEMYFHKPYEPHMLELIKGNAPNVFIITFLSSSSAMRYFEERKITATMSTKQNISAILHEASATYDMTINNPKIEIMRSKEIDCLWGGEQTIRMRLELMLISLIRRNGYYASERRFFNHEGTVTDKLALRVIEFMEERLYGRFTIDELSREFSFSKTHLSQTFAKATGYSIIEYFNIMKVAEAKRLIRETEFNFSEISEKLLFSNSHYFSSTFRKYTGMTPSSYKRSCRQE